MRDLIYDKEVKLDNGNTIYYREKDGTFFEAGILVGRENKLEDYSKTVNDKLMNTLNNYIKGKWRVRIWLGDTETGKAWNEDYSVTGTIGRTGGEIKIPILVNNKRSWGGEPLLVGSIVRIDDIEDKKTIWKVDNFYIPEMKLEYEENKEGYNWRVYQEGNNIANFKRESSAKRWIDFMTGKRYNK